MMTSKEKAIKCWYVYNPHQNFYNLNSDSQREWFRVVEEFEKILSVKSADDNIDIKEHCKDQYDWDGNE